jgi:hypothetical protein
MRYFCWVLALLGLHVFAKLGALNKKCVIPNAKHMTFSGGLKTSFIARLKNIWRTHNEKYFV